MVSIHMEMGREVSMGDTGKHMYVVHTPQVTPQVSTSATTEVYTCTSCLQQQKLFHYLVILEVYKIDNNYYYALQQQLCLGNQSLTTAHIN